MNDLKISAQATIAYSLWVAAFVLTLLYTLMGLRTGALGILLAGVAMVLQIRGFFCSLVHREKAAFDIGLAAGRTLHLQR